MKVKVTKFQDLTVWREARRLASEVYQITAVKAFERDWSLRDQIRRAAVSIMANIAEGYGRGSKKDFARYLAIALGSVTELHSHFYLASDMKYIDPENFRRVEAMIENVSRQLAGFNKYLKSQE